jgi:hypothetical protein
LQKDEATRLIDRLQGALGIAPTKPKHRVRRSDRAAGMDGRKTDNASLPLGATVATLPSAADVERIQNALTRLGWTQVQYEAWLRSARSPLAVKHGSVRVAPADITLRTLRDANRVWWALKGMLTAKGLWRKES